MYLLRDGASEKESALFLKVLVIHIHLQWQIHNKYLSPSPGSPRREVLGKNMFSGKRGFG